MAVIGRSFVMFAPDVVGPSSLITADEEGILERLKAHQYQFIYSKVAQYHGRVISAPGDGVFVEFSSPIEAVRCAVEVQRGVIDRNVGTEPEWKIKFRVGIDIGKQTSIGGDLVSRAVAALPIDRLATLIKPGTKISGDDVTMAMSIAALADPEGICVSGTIQEGIHDQLPYTFQDIGEQIVDGTLVHCYAMRAGSVALRSRVAAHKQGAPANDGDVYLPANGRPSPIVDNIVQKSVIIAAVGFTMAVWIVSGWTFLDSLYHLPANSPSSVASKPVSLALVATDHPPKPAESGLPPEPQSPSTLPPANPIGVRDNKTPSIRDDKELIDPAVRDLITHGWALYHLPYTSVSWQEARRYFERALELDSRSSEARIGLASILSTKLANGWFPVLQEDIPRAEQLLLEVLDTGNVSNQAAARFTLGVLRQMQVRLPEAKREFEMAISLDPENGSAHFHLGETLMYLGRPEAGIRALEKTIQHDPNQALAYWALGTCQLLSGRVDQAINLLRMARDSNARYWVPHFYLAGAYGLQGHLEEARSALAVSKELRPAIRSLARMRVENRWLSNPEYWALQEQTLNLGLRRAGLPDQ
jgi:adenylate cyclase